MKKKYVIMCVVLVAVIALSACTVFALEGKISFGPNIEQFYNKIFSDDPDENANIAQQKIEEEVAKYEAENSKNSETSEIITEAENSKKPETSEKVTESEVSKNEEHVHVPIEYPEVFNGISPNGDVVLELPQGQLIQNGESIIWKETDGVEKILVTAEEGHKNNQVCVHNISPDGQFVYYKKSIIPTSGYGNEAFTGGFIDMKSLTVIPLDLTIVNTGYDSDCVWSNTGKYAAFYTYEGYVLVNTSDLQMSAPLHLGSFTFSPDETKLAYWVKSSQTSSTRNLFIYDITTGEEKLLTSVTFDEGPSLPPMGPFWQGNDTILFNNGKVSTETGKYTNRNKIKSVDVSTGNVSDLFPDGAEKRIFDYEYPFVYGTSSDGRYVLFASGGLKILDTQEGTLTASDVFDRYSSGLDDIDFRWDAETSSFKAYGVYDYEGAKEVDISLSLDGKTAVADKKLTITDPTFEVASIS